MDRKSARGSAVALLALMLLGAACNTSTPKFSLTHAERRGRLQSNGLRFVIMPDASTQLVEVDVRYEVGQKEDPPGKAGLAHLVEHIMFQLRPDGPNTTPLMKSINDLTTRFNAYTSWDTTHYQNTARAEQVSDLLKIEAMRLYFGCQTVSEEEFLREREVVRNEIRQRGGTPEGQIPQLVLSAVYPKGHAYERMIGGDDSQLTSITLEDTCKFIKDYYVPERATVIVAGGVNVDDTVALIQKWFSKLEKRTGAPPKAVDVVNATASRTEYEVAVDRPLLNIAFALPSSNTPEGEAAAYGINSAFGRIAGADSEWEFATDVSGGQLGGQLAPMFMITIELKSMDKLNEALQFAESAVKQAYRGWDEGSYDMIEELKNRRKADFIQSLEPLLARTNVIGDLVQFDTNFDFDSNDLYMFHELDKIDDFNGAKIAAAVKKYITMDKAKIVIIKPSESGITGDRRMNVAFNAKSHEEKEIEDVDPSEARRPFKVSGELKAFAGTETRTLGNGMTLIMLPVKSMPLVAARMVFKNVGAAMTPDNPMLPVAAAQFLSLPMDAEAFARTGVRVGCQATDDATYCQSGGINIYLDVMMKGIDRLVKAGTYSQGQVESYQKSMRDQLATKTMQSAVEYERQWATALYGAEHPYTATAVESVEAANKLSKDSLENFRDANYTASNATLIIVGDFDPARAESLANEVFGGWDRGTPAKAIEPSTKLNAGPQYIGVVTARELPQVEVRVGYPAPAGIDGQEAARRLLAQMMQYRVDDVRFKLGSTYGVYAGRQAHKGPTMYQIRGPIDGQRAGESLKAIRAGIDELRGGTTFDSDFVRARRKLVSTMFGESTVTGELAARLAIMALYDLDKKYYNMQLQQTAAASPAQLHALLKAELDPNREVIVIHGSRAQIEKAFADAGISDVKIIEPAYK